MYDYQAHILTTNKQRGDELFSKLAVEDCDMAAFTNGDFPCGATKEGAATHWAFLGPVVEAAYLALGELSTDGPYTSLTALGFTAQDIADAKSIFTVEIGLRDADMLENKVHTFIQRNGLVRQN